jgi:hypothetical protein
MRRVALGKPTAYEQELIAMLPVIGLVALLLYLVLWQTGLLQDLSTAAAARRARPKAKRRTPDSGDRTRLNVFEEFIERLGDDDEPPRPQDPPG